MQEVDHQVPAGKLQQARQGGFDEPVIVADIEIERARAEHHVERFGLERLRLVEVEQVGAVELVSLVASAGLHLESMTGDFLDLSLNPDIESQVVVATKP